MRRNNLQIYMDLLSCLSDGKEKRITDIVCASNVNAVFAKKALYLAVKRGEVKEIKKGRKSDYVIDNKGLDLVNGFKPYKEFSEKLEATIK